MVTTTVVFKYCEMGALQTSLEIPPTVLFSIVNVSYLGW